MNKLFSPALAVSSHRSRTAWQSGLSMALLLALMATAGCAGRRLAQPAPVEDRGSAPLVRPAEVKPMPGAENAGKPGYYTVQPGDTLFRIALDAGQTWRDVQTWNNLVNPNLIEVGQVLRVSPPVGSVASAAPAVSSGVTSAPVVATTVVSRPLSSTGTGTTTVPVAATSTAVATPAAVAASPASAGVPAADVVNFVWPAQGAVVASFDEAKNKGIGIAGKVGDPVLAAADGRVVYAGAGLRGYGNLIILKHNNTFLTAYAHNQALLVREDQTVKQGQRIAEMGSSDADRVKLHFEVRRLGKPVDPLSFLPKR